MTTTAKGNETADKKATNSESVTVKFICNAGVKSYEFDKEQVKAATDASYLNHVFNQLLNGCASSVLGSQYEQLSAEKAKQVEDKVIHGIYCKFHIYAQTDLFMDEVPTILAAYHHKKPEHLNEMFKSGSVEIVADDLALMYGCDLQEFNKPLRLSELSKNRYRFVHDLSELPDGFPQELTEKVKLAKAEATKNGAPESEPVLLVFNKESGEITCHTKQSFDSENQKNDFDLILEDSLS